MMTSLKFGLAIGWRGWRCPLIGQDYPVGSKGENGWLWVTVQLRVWTFDEGPRQQNVQPTVNIAFILSSTMSINLVIVNPCCGGFGKTVGLDSNRFSENGLIETFILSSISILNHHFTAATSNNLSAVSYKYRGWWYTFIFKRQNNLRSSLVATIEQ